MRKYIYILLTTVVASLGATSCDDYLDVNKNTDAPDYVDGYLYLAGIEQSYQELYYDLRAIAPLTQMMGTSSYVSYALHYYSRNSDAAGQVWRMLYWSQGMNLENMINQSLEAQNWTLAGMGYIMKAYSWDVATKQHGEMPMKEAYEAGRLSHDYDYQPEIYAQIREWAKTGIELLQREDNSVYGSKISNNDYIYHGDKDKWIKFGYAVIVRNLASLTCKRDFKAKYYDEFIDACSKAFAGNSDNATVEVGGGGADASESAYNNFWGPYRSNLSWSYFQHDYAVEVFTGTVPYYDANGDKVPVDSNTYCPYELASKQVICDTLEEAGHMDPRVFAKLATVDKDSLATIDDWMTLRKLRYFGGGFTGYSGPIGSAPSFFGRNHASDDDAEGNGRWLYRNNAPYILSTYAEVLFDKAEVQYKYGDKTEAFETWKQAIAADMEFTASYLVPGVAIQNSGTGAHQGDKITAATFKKIAQEYLDGPYVAGLPMSDFDLSHIMMQKFVALYPWGAGEVWVDQRKYMYDIAYSGDYPSNGNGWDKTTLNQKSDDDPTKVYKGYYLYPAQVQGRKGSYNDDNNGSPCFRLRPRYNSEYMWNLPSLQALRPIAGDAKDYQCSIPWFAYPGDMPQ